MQKKMTNTQSLRDLSSRRNSHVVNFMEMNDSMKQFIQLSVALVLIAVLAKLLYLICAWFIIVSIFSAIIKI
jgi:lipopolysaccharide/colanic/teichoic acid biosynthesis glycosyltransferase